MEDGTLAEGWFRRTLKASETGIIPTAELESLRTALTDEQYAQEFECSFEAAIIGAYYGKQMASLSQQGDRIAGFPMILQHESIRHGI